MEEGEGEGMERITIEEDFDNKQKKNVPVAPPLPGATSKEPETQKETVPVTEQSPSLRRSSVLVVDDEDEDKKLKSEWTEMFLKNNGF